MDATASAALRTAATHCSRAPGLCIALSGAEGATNRTAASLCRARPERSHLSRHDVQHVALSDARARRDERLGATPSSAELMGINCWMSPAKTPALRRSRWLNDGAARSEPTVCCGLRLVPARCYFLPALSDGLLQE